MGAQAVLGLTWADRTPFGDALAEVKVVQPVLMLEAARGWFRFHGTVNAEGATLRHGELMPGVWGEGFNDRRHPHTWLHEVMAGVTAHGFSLTAGKGFVPFGTDDPMNRPAIRFPVNHHLSQVLERAVVIAGARRGPLALEAAIFNGDEPERPGQAPNWDRFHDSWSARATLLPAGGLELQLSFADITSPENRTGFGPEQRKWSVSARVERPAAGGTVTALAEWARTGELSNTFRYHTALAEGQLARGPGRLYLRLERTERPEEQRTFEDAFRSVRPHLDNSILGITRWSMVTVGAARTWTLPRGFRVEPVVELSHLRITNVAGVVQRPELLFGRAHLWSATLALRVGAGRAMHRMGRYGVLAAPAHGHE